MLVVVSIIFVFLLVPSAFSQSNFGCCIDTVSGCRNVFTDQEIATCQERFAFESGTSCFPIAAQPDIPVTDNPICGNIGCCCFDDGTFAGGVVQDTCSNLGGNYRAGSDCSAACGAPPVDTDITCSDLNGFWCEAGDKSENAEVLTGITNFDDRPSTTSQCYNIQCVTDSCEKGDEGFEIFCADGENNDQDCSIDTLDDDCQNSVAGTVKDINGRAISNVKVVITNNLAAQYGKDESYTTFSVSGGDYFFQGMSYGNSYRVEVDDPFWEAVVLPDTFRLSTNNKFANNKDIVVVPRDAQPVAGTVKDESGNLIEDALVLVENTEFAQNTDSEGEFFFEHIPKGSYDALAFKDGFFPSNKKRFSVQNDPVSFDLILRTEGCDVASPVPQLVNATNTRGNTHINLQFKSTGCFPQAFAIHRCNQDLQTCTNSSEFAILDVLGKNAETYIDEDTEWNTTYSYFVTAFYGEGASRQSDASNIISIYTGDDDCEDRLHSGQFCDYQFSYQDGIKQLAGSNGFFCDANNQLNVVRVCTDETKCIETQSGDSQSETICKTLDICEPVEENLFGLYFTEDICEGPNNQRFCVFDYSATNVDSCFSCSQYTSCFDYRSEGTCEENICGVGECEWVETDATLNQGICIDKTRNVCEDCNNPFNQVFGSCNADLCSQLGACSYSALDQKCETCGEVSCYDYTSPDFCDSRKRIEINLKDNSLQRASQDSCELGSCIWNAVGQSCAKDADGDGRDDCESFAGAGDYLEEYCLVDTIPPETTVKFEKKVLQSYRPDKRC